MLSQKGPACSAAEQCAYLVSWFSEYSDLQRDDFLHVLADKYTPLGPAVDGTLGLSGLSIGGVNPDAPPSLFQCRMSLFDQWFQGWSDEDKANFLDRLRSIDPEFVDRLSSVPNGTADHIPVSPAATTVVVNHCTSVTVNGDSLKVDDDEEAEGAVEEEEGNREVVSPTEEPQALPRTVVSPSSGGSVEEERVSPLGEKIEYDDDGELVL